MTYFAGFPLKQFQTQFPLPLFSTSMTNPIASMNVTNQPFALRNLFRDGQRLLFALLVFSVAAGVGQTQTSAAVPPAGKPAPATSKTLRVGTRVLPPFVMRINGQ